MQFRAERDSLAEAVSLSTHVASTRSTISPLPNLVRLDVADNTLELLATDLDTAIRSTVPVTMAVPGTCLVPSRLLADIVRYLPEGAVDVSMDSDGTLRVTGDRNIFNLRTALVDDFIPVGFSTDDTVRLPAAQLITSIKQVTRSAATDDSRPLLTGVSIQQSATTIRLLATDSYRVSIKEISNTNGSSSDTSEYVIPAKVLRELSRIIGSTDANAGNEDSLVGIHLSDTDACFHYGSVAVYTRLMDGRFPPFDSIIKPTYDNRILVDITEIADALKRVGLLAKDEMTKVTIHPEDGIISLRVVSQQLGEASAAVPALFEGDTQSTIGFNPAYLLDGIDALEGDKCEIRYSGDDAAALITTPEDASFRYLLMPIKIKT